MAKHDDDGYQSAPACDEVQPGQRRLPAKRRIAPVADPEHDEREPDEWHDAEQRLADQLDSSTDPNPDEECIW